MEGAMNTSRHFVPSLLVFPLFLTVNTWAITIDSVTINYTNNQITISGKKLSQATTPPVVTFNEISLRVISASCTPSGDCTAVAVLPSNIAAGTYRLTVVNPATGASFEFDLTYGAAGPSGPIGPQGPAGVLIYS
jgi:hypothetical protein